MVRGVPGIPWGAEVSETTIAGRCTAASSREARRSCLSVSDGSSGEGKECVVLYINLYVMQGRIRVMQ